jgi:dTMP kinase
MNHTSPYQHLAGRFLVIDGPDGAGKTTQQALLARSLREEGLDVSTLRDPGGTAIGDRIRKILLDPEATEMSVACETLLYMASRAQLAHELIRPALSAGACVLMDRFISSTIAYQGAGGEDVEEILTAGRIAVGDLWPDLTLLLDLPSREGLDRSAKRGRLDRMESKTLAFHERVRKGFLDQAQQDPEHFLVIDASSDPQSVHASICDHLAQWRSRTG